MRDLNGNFFSFFYRVKVETQVGKGSWNVPVARTVYKATARHPVLQMSLRYLKERCVCVCVCARKRESARASICNFVL